VNIKNPYVFALVGDQSRRLLQIDDLCWFHDLKTRGYALQLQLRYLIAITMAGH
jgi:hypothetical protein